MEHVQSLLRAAGVALVVFAPSVCTAASATVDTRVEVPVAICNASEVPGPVMSRAEQIAADVYRDIGVALAWSEGACDEDGSLVVNMITHDASHERFTNVAVGFAEPGTSLATVLSDRVLASAKRYRVNSGVLLGYVIAHEIGHLLLPPNSHSPAGVMRATVNLEQASARRLRFTREQGQLIVRRLEGADLTLATH